MVANALGVRPASEVKIDLVILDHVAVIVVASEANAVAASPFGAHAYSADPANRVHFHHGGPPKGCSRPRPNTLQEISPAQQLGLPSVVGRAQTTIRSLLSATSGTFRHPQGSRDQRSKQYHARIRRLKPVIRRMRSCGAIHAITSTRDSRTVGSRVGYSIGMSPGFSPFKDLVAEDHNAREVNLAIGSVAHQHAGLGLIRLESNAGQSMLLCRRGEIPPGGIGRRQNDVPGSLRRPKTTQCIVEICDRVEFDPTVSSPLPAPQPARSPIDRGRAWIPQPGHALDRWRSLA